MKNIYTKKNKERSLNDNGILDFKTVKKTHLFLLYYFLVLTLLLLLNAYCTYSLRLRGFSSIKMFMHKVRRFPYQEHQHVPGGQPRPLHPGSDEAGPLREANQADLGGELLRDVALELALAIASKLI